MIHFLFAVGLGLGINYSIIVLYDLFTQDDEHD